MVMDKQYSSSRPLVQELCHAHSSQVQGGLVRGRGLGSIGVNHSFDDVSESDTRIALSQHEIVRGTIEPSPQRVQCPVSMSPPVTARNDVGGTIAHGMALRQQCQRNDNELQPSCHHRDPQTR